MTSSPKDLTAIAQYVVDATPLSWSDMGIVGDPAHAATGGYHEGNDDLSRVGRLNSDYSKRESGRDRPGTNSASALDIGWWSGRVGAAQLTRLEFNARLVAACQRNDPRTRDIREVIYTPDGVTVKRWDRLGQRSTGDSSHLYHTHLSFFRDSEGRRANEDNALGLIRSILNGETALMELTGLDRAQVNNSEHYLQALIALDDDAKLISDTVNNNIVRPNMLARFLKRIDTNVIGLVAATTAEQARDAALKTVIDGLVKMVNDAGGDIDSAALVAKVNDAVHEAVAPLQDLIVDLRHRIAEYEKAEAQAQLDAAQKIEAK